jgi:plastocyanin
MPMQAFAWNRRTFLRTVGVLSLAGPAVLLASCKHDKKPSEAGDAPQPPKDQAQIHIVRMVTDGERHFFDPDRLVIRPGDKVKWVLQSMVHTTTAYHPQFFGKPLRIPEQAEPWHSGVLTEIGQSYERTFEVEGVYNYYCTPHQSLGMVGIIVVGKPLDGPGLVPPEMMPMEEGIMMEGMIYEREAEKLMELIEWVKALRPS